MYVSYLKWSLYARIKRKFLNIKLFKEIPPKVLILFYSILQIIKVISVVIIMNLILNNSYIKIENIYMDLILKRVQENKIFLLLLFALYIILEIQKKSIKTVKIKEDNPFKVWLLANTSAKENKLNILVLLEYILFSSIDIVTFQIPVIGVILIRNKFLLSSICVISILYIAIVLLLTIFISLIYNIYLSWVNKSKRISIIIIKNIIERVVAFAILYFCGSSLSSWMNDFPLIHRTVDVSKFEQWVNSLKINYIYYIENVISNILESIIKKGQVFFIVCMITIIILLCCSIVIIEKVGRKRVEENRIDTVYKEVGKKSNIFNYYFKIIIKSKYVIRNLNVFCGSIFYWSIIGFYSGILKNIDVNSKVYYFLLMSYIFYPSFFLIESILENLPGKYCIDGEGKKIYFWVNKNIFKLFRYKRVFSSMNILVLVIITNLMVRLFNNVSLNLTFRLIFIQLIFTYTIFNILSIASVIFPHFEYVNIEELNEYTDRKELNNTISFIVLFAGIPILVLPTVLYLTEYINNIFIYNVLQIYGIAFILVLVNILIDTFIKKKLNNEKFIYSIFDN